MKHLVDRYGLKPQENLRIIAFNVWKRQPVVFEGTNYDLAAAIAASCSIPAVMRPVWGSTSEASGGAGLLVDGGVHHLHPVEFCNGPALVSKLGPATRFPPRSLPIPFWGPHMAEVMSSLLLGIHSRDPEGDHIVIDVARPDIGGLDFGLPRDVWFELVEYGYRQAQEALDEPIRLKKVPTLL
jgi:predicted acylesterase/phospholipase RssA